MLISRNNFFLAIFLLVIAPILLQKIWWLANAEKANGTMCFVGKNISGQMVSTYSVIMFKKGNDTIFLNSPDNIIFSKGESVPVKYQRTNPDNARVNTFLGIWGDTLIYCAIPLLILVMVFLHPDVVPYRSIIKLQLTKPVISFNQPL